MSKLYDKKFKELIINFYRIKKRVLQKRPISTNIQKINEYTKLLIENYNSILEYTETNFIYLSESDKSKYISKINVCRNLLIKCFKKLNCKIEVPHTILGENLFTRVRESVMTETNSEISSDDSQKTRIKMATTERKNHILLCAHQL